MTFTYRKLVGIKQEAYSVSIDGRRTGLIKRTVDGYFYQPDKTKFRGENFATLDQCKRSLEEES